MLALAVIVLYLSYKLWKTHQELKEAKEEVTAAAYLQAYMFGICQNFAISFAESESGLTAKQDEVFLMAGSGEDGGLPQIYIRIPSRQTLTEFVIFRMHPEDPRAVCIGMFLNKQIVWANNCSRHIKGSELTPGDSKALNNTLRYLSSIGQQGADALRKDTEAQT